MRKIQNKPGIDQSARRDQLYFHIVGWTNHILLVATITSVNDTECGPKCFIKLLSSEQPAVSRNLMHTSTKVYESIRCYIPCNYGYIKCTHTHTLNHWHKEAEDEDRVRPVLFWVFFLPAMSSQAQVRPNPVTNIPWDPAEQNKQSSKWSAAIFKVYI